MPTKIPNVPQIPGMHVEHYNFLQKLKDSVLELQKSSLPPDDPRNLTVSPIALGNNVQWTRSNNADRYTLYISNDPTSQASSHQGSIAVDVGDSNYYNDIVGQAAYKRFYWVKAWNGKSGSRLVGPKSGTTLAAGATVAPPKQVSPGVIVVDETTGLTTSGRPGTIPGGPQRGR